MRARNSEATEKRESQRKFGRLFSTACRLIPSVVVLLLLPQVILAFYASDGGSVGLPVSSGTSG